MKKMFKHYSIVASLVGLLMLTFSNASSQVAFQLELLPNSCTYQVSVVPEVDWGFPQNITATARVLLRVPTDSGFEIGNIQNIAGSWANNITIVAPDENPLYDYFIIELVSLGTDAIDYVAEQVSPLFTFNNVGTCGGDISLLPIDDPFAIANASSFTLINQISTLGSGNINAWNGNVTDPIPCVLGADNDGDSFTVCEDPNDENACIPDCGACGGELATKELERQGALYGVTDFPLDGDETYTWYDETGKQVAYFVGRPYYSPSKLGTYTLIVQDPDYPECQQVIGDRMIESLEGCCELEK